MSTVDHQVRAIIAEQLGISTLVLKDEQTLVLDLAADSLDLAELVMAIEDHFDIEVSDAEVLQMNTVRDVINAVMQKVG